MGLVADALAHHLEGLGHHQERLGIVLAHHVFEAGQLLEGEDRVENALLLPGVPAFPSTSDRS